MPEAATAETPEAVETPITVTDEAAERLVDEIEGKDDVQALRMLAQEGCCGYGYALAMAKREPEETEHVVDANGVTVYLDDQTLERVRGATIAWTEGVFGAGFTIENPNEPDEGACGCR
jgi:iron-sulfur cluster assembly accessory protein